MHILPTLHHPSFNMDKKNEYFIASIDDQEINMQKPFPKEIHSISTCT
jgi:hypothetical protein